ncbi:MAG: glycyl-radical enzyme activating protein [candidate division WOR-3 bacterium]|nr:MAG: glycyl-radical enzyme activating protein [candidate division WOR-3 bacterium]
MPSSIVKKGIIFDVVKYAIHDGPGIRTTVFLKGCPLKCLWCQNPESQKPEPETVGRFRDRKFSAMFFGKDKGIIGHEFTVRQVMAEVRKDDIFYRYSGGGVTFSGGEPLMQSEFLLYLLKESKKHNIHTAVDTSGHAPWSALERIVKYVDLFLYDIKLMDDVEHERYTGVGSELVLSNLRKLAARGAKIVVRFPVITGITDRPENTRAIGTFLKGLKSIDTMHLLPYNYMCKDKYKRMKREYLLDDVEPPSDGILRSLSKKFGQYGLRVETGDLE